MDGCIFCKIISGEISSYKIYENDKIVAFLDINPLVVGHVLVLPKNHYKWVWDLNNEDYSALMLGVKVVANALRNKFDTEFIGEGIVGVDISHAHVHLMPRKIGDNLGAFPKDIISPKPSADEFNKIAQEIRERI